MSSNHLAFNHDLKPVDRHVAKGLEDLRKGRTHGPYAAAEEAIKAMEERSQRRAPRKRKPETGSSISTGSD